MEDCSTKVAKLKKKVDKFVEDRDWNNSHNPKNLSMSIAIEAGELMEIFQWLTIKDSWDIIENEEFEHMKEELADVMIYCFSLANQLDIDITTAVFDKISKNGDRYPVEDECD